MSNIKPLLLLAIATLSAAAVNAQPSPGTFSIIPRIGVAFANVSNESVVFSSVSNPETISGSKYREGFTGGVDLQYQATPAVAISAGVFYARQGCKYKDTDLTGAVPENKYDVYSNCRLDLDYVQVPLRAHLYIAQGLSVNAGVQAGFLTNNNTHFEQSEVTINKDGSYTYTSEMTEQDKRSSQLRSFDFSIPLGISYEYANVVLDFRYNINLTKMYKGVLSGNDCKNRTLALTVGYKLDL